MAYNVQTWTPGTAITQDRMTHIENGIATAQTTADNAVSQTDPTYTQLKTDVNTLNLDINAESYGLKGKVDRVSSQASNAVTTANEALGQITAATTGIDPNKYPNLATRLDKMDAVSTNIGSELTRTQNSLTIVQQNVDNAKRLGMPNDTLSDRFNFIETEVSSVKNNYTAASGSPIQQGSEQVQRSLKERLDNIDNDSKPSRTLPNIITEIDAAHRTDNDTLNARFSAIETEISTARGGQSDLDTRLDNIDNSINSGISNLNESKVNKSDIVNNLNATVSGSVLDAVQGKVLNDRITSVESSATTRLTNVEGRATTLEGKATALETNVQTIAEELAMVDGNAIKNTNTRIDSLDERLTETEGAIDTLEANLGSGFDSTNTVAQKITDAISAATDAAAADATTKANAAETNAKNYTDTGLANVNAQLALKANASDMTSALAGKADKATVNAISTTIVKAKNEVAYTNEVPSNTQTWTIEDKNDYLLQAEDDKYYYWKHINNEWHLMGGAGGGGTGNSSGAFAASLNEIQTPDINTDYFVGNNTDGYFHYRFIPQENSDELQPVLIGTKDYYQIDTRDVSEDNDTVTYLDLYRFDTNRTQSSITEDDAANIIGSVKLPKGGGGSSTTERIYVKIPAGQTQYISYKDLQDNGLNLQFSYTCYSLVDGNYYYTNAAYVLSLADGKVIIPSDNVNSLTRQQYNENVTNIKFNKADNLAQYCQKNVSTKFILTLSVPDDNTITPRSLTVTVTPIELALSSTFSDQRTFVNTDDLEIPYTFTGITGEDINFEILFGDGNTEENITALSVINQQASRITIRRSVLANKAGIYNLSIRAGQLISGSMLYSNTLTYQLGLISTDYTNVLLFSGASIKEQIIEQYRTLTLPYYLYLPSNMQSALVSYDVKQVIYNDQNVVIQEDTIPALIRPADTLTAGAHNYSLRISSMISNTEYYKVTITCEDASITFNIRANMAAEQINIETRGLVFDFKPEQFSNNAATLEERLWHYESNGIKYSMRVPDNAHFDWRTGGWIEDENHVPCFCVKAGSRVEFIQQNIGQDNISPLTLFWNGMETTGSDFKCVFKIDNVKTPDAPFLTSLDTTENTIINYGKLILSDKQDIEDDDTLLHSYLNTRYLYTKTINNNNKVVKESIGTTVLNDAVEGVYGRFGSQLTEDKRAAAETKAVKKNQDKIKNYISNIYTIANYARTLEHKEALLNILSGNPIGTSIDYTTIKDTILAYLQNVTQATDVYTTLTTMENDTSSVIYAYRQEEPENLDAILNGFVVEGKEGKDGIIAMLQFTFKTTIENGGTFTSQTVVPSSEEAEWPRVNTFTGTATFLVMVEDKKYEVTMKDEDGTYTEIVSIQDASNETQTAYGLELNALGSNIYLPSGRVSYAHSEGDTIEFEYNINAPLEQKINSSIIIYEDGVPSAAKLYTIGNNILEQEAPGSLIIGSDDCDVYIYKMRLYNHALTDKQILSNFYADGLTVDDMIARYNRNKNLITNNIDELTPQLVATECPDLRVIMIEAPNLTSGKTSFVKDTKIRCIYKNGRPEDNWVALNAYHAGQGTSSDNYGASARNLDIIFGFDGKDTVIVPKPQKNNYQFDPNYKSIIITGLNDDMTNDIKTVEEYEAAGKYSIHNNAIEDIPGTISLSPSSVPNNWFNIKVNVASSENTNNAFLQKRFDRYLRKHVYTTPAQERDPRIKNDMEFFNCVVFIKETGTPKEFTKDTGAERSWHLYAIGNIGDSKKTDKTRVNVPNDPYEFAVEITDNGLLLSGFSSGVFYISEASKLRSQTARNLANGNMDIPEALSMTDSHVCTTEEYSINDGNYTFSILAPDSSTMYFVPENNGEYYRRFIYLNNTWTEVGEPVSFTRTSYGIKYPVSRAEWECSLNTYHSALYTFDGKGWDKSFEFRYDITTKDGETVARGDLEEALNKLHQSTNKKAFADMYSYIVTVPNANFVSQLNDWFIENSLPYWYLFTERYTMIDSRAKNTFYHYGKIYITEDEASGARITALNEIKTSHLAEYIEQHHIEDYKTATAEEIANAELDYQIATATFLYENAQYFKVDNAKATTNNGYRFELWGYDMDTALGINNNGQMVFSAGIEDTDKDASGWIYNEAESVIWRRVRENMYNQLAALYINLKGDCFNAENIINEFDTLQAQFPEELWRADFERKYYRPFRDLNETTYLNDMANGRKKYQRRQFERNMAIYINSKYQRNGSYLENDHISFRPQFTWTSGRDTRIIIKPYSTMYINFALGNYDNTNDSIADGKQIFKRVERGEEFVINTADYINDYNNIQCIIYNASRIMYLDGLGNFECKQFILGAAKKLSVLKLGSPNYVNRSMNDITNLGLSTGLPLLEELDLTNIEFGFIKDGTWINNPPQTFALENFPLLKRLNAEGCNIRSFTFKDGGMLEHIVFPGGTTRIQFKNLYKLVDTYEDDVLVPAVEFPAGATNLISYYSVNSYLSSYNIVQNMMLNSKNRITQLCLDGFDWTIENMSELEQFKELQKKLGNNMFLKGTVRVTGAWSKIEQTDYKSIWPDLIFVTNPDNEQQKVKVTYMESAHWEGETWVEAQQIGDSIYVAATGKDSDRTIPDIYYGSQLSDLPTRPSTIDEVFSFGEILDGQYLMYSGWSKTQGSNAVPLNSLNGGNYGINNLYRATSNDVETGITLYTYYKASAHKYTVRWHLDDNTIVKSMSNQDAHGGYTLEAPTVKEMRTGAVDYSNKLASYSFKDDTVTYKIFDGWEKLPTDISPTLEESDTSIYRIDAKWYEETKPLTGENGLFKNTSNLTLDQLFILSHMDSSMKNSFTDSKQITTNQKFSYTMGYDGLKDGLVFANNKNFINSPATLIAGEYATVDGQRIAPFSNNDGFTIAIDYQFDKNQNLNSKAAVLVGCYNKNEGNITGFALYRNGASTGEVRIGYGDFINDSNKSKVINNSGARNIVVIRHPKGSSILYIYSSAAKNDITAINLPNVESIDVNTQLIDNNAFICLGNLRTDISGDSALSDNPSYTNEINNAGNAYGTIYWAKYWPEDLGAGECKQLAAWPHESMTSMIAAIGSNQTTLPNIYLSNLNASQHASVLPSPLGSTPAELGWGNSIIKQICDNRIFAGLPIRMQSIIGKINIGYYNASVTYNGFNESTYAKTKLLTDGAFVYVPSISSLTSSMNTYNTESIVERTGNSSNDTSDITPYPWLNTPIEIYDWDINTETHWVKSDMVSNSNYLNIRFANKSLLSLGKDNNLRIFCINAPNPTLINGRIYDEINSNITDGIKTNDIIIINNIAYLYISSTDYAPYAMDIVSSSTDSRLNTNGNGGWIKSIAYPTRSVSYGNNQSNFIYIKQDGNMVVPSSSNDQPSSQRSFDSKLNLTYAYTI